MSRKELASIIEPMSHLVRRLIPYGVMAAIVPWNAPISLATAKVIPALLAGNAVIIKPSPGHHGGDEILGLVAQLSTSGSHQCAHGLDELGEAMIKHKEIRKISFTGSTAVGKGSP